tara:strand:- start:156 stop:356 length:201 start_codon:yes stop_codon:yes gene_type:complete
MLRPLLHALLRVFLQKYNNGALVFRVFVAQVYLFLAAMFLPHAHGALQPALQYAPSVQLSRAVLPR